MQNGSELPEYVAPNLRNGGSQSPDRWLKEPRNNQNRKVYDDEILTVYYNKINLDSVQFVVDNKRHNAITVGFWDKVTINGVEYNASVVGINALSSGKYSAGLTSLDGSSVQITEFERFEGIMSVLDAHNGKLEDIKLDFSES